MSSGRTSPRSLVSSDPARSHRQSRRGGGSQKRGQQLTTRRAIRLRRGASTRRVGRSSRSACRPRRSRRCRSLSRNTRSLARRCPRRCTRLRCHRRRRHRRPDPGHRGHPPPPRPARRICGTPGCSRGSFGRRRRLRLPYGRRRHTDMPGLRPAGVTGARRLRARMGVPQRGVPRVRSGGRRERAPAARRAVSARRQRTGSLNSTPLASGLRPSPRHRAAGSRRRPTRR